MPVPPQGTGGREGTYNPRVRETDGTETAMAVGTRRADSRTSEHPRSLTAPGIVLGVGLGGFVDGILLHRLL